MLVEDELLYARGWEVILRDRQQTRSGWTDVDVTVTTTATDRQADFRLALNNEDCSLLSNRAVRKADLRVFGYASHNSLLVGR